MKVQIDQVQAVDMAEFPLTPSEQLIMSDCVKISDPVWMGRIDGEIVCMWGLIPQTILSLQAYLWLYNTEKTKDHQFLFVRYSQRVIEVILREYPCIVGHAVAGQDDSIRWLRWLGAKFSEPVGKLIPFKIERKHG